MNTHQTTLQIAFKKIIESVVFKGNALKDIQRIAIETLAKVEQESVQRFNALSQEANERIQALNAQLQTTVASKTLAHDQITALQTRLETVISQGNHARKSAAARANRYKMKYDHLLDDIEHLLPGAKPLLTSHTISQIEKVKKLKQLECAIARQKKRTHEKVIYNAEKRRDVYLPGFGRQCRILQVLMARKQRLGEQKSY